MTSKFILFILIVTSSLTDASTTKYRERWWVCTGEVTQYTDIDCETMAAKAGGAVDGCYHVEGFQQYKSCGETCNNVIKGSSFEEHCDRVCKWYLSDNCVVEWKDRTTPTTVAMTNKTSAANKPSNASQLPYQSTTTTTTTRESSNTGIIAGFTGLAVVLVAALIGIIVWKIVLPWQRERSEEAAGSGSSGSSEEGGDEIGLPVINGTNRRGNTSPDEHNSQEARPLLELTAGNSQRSSPQAQSPRVSPPASPPASPPVSPPVSQPASPPASPPVSPPVSQPVSPRVSPINSEEAAAGAVGPPPPDSTVDLPHGAENTDNKINDLKDLKVDMSRQPGLSGEGNSHHPHLPDKMAPLNQDVTSGTSRSVEDSQMRSEPPRDIYSIQATSRAASLDPVPAADSILSDFDRGSTASITEPAPVDSLQSV